MKIAFPISNHKGLDDYIFEHFGHAPAFLIVEVSEDKRILNTEIIDNVYRETHGPGEIPSFLASKGVNVLICRGIGRRAIEFFNKMGIEVIRGAFGKVKDVLNQYLSGKLESREYRPRYRWLESFR